MEIEPLSERWKLFAVEYCIDFVVSRAAERAGVSLPAAYRMIGDPRIVAMIKEAKRKVSERVNISMDNTLEQLRMIANGDVVAVMRGIELGEPDDTLAQRLDRLPPELKYAIKSIKPTKYGFEFVMHDKTAAVKLIGQYYGLFKDTIQLTGPGGGPLEMITGTMSPKEAADAYQAMLTPPG